MHCAYISTTDFSTNTSQSMRDGENQSDSQRGMRNREEKNDVQITNQLLCSSSCVAATHISSSSAKKKLGGGNQFRSLSLSLLPIKASFEKERKFCGFREPPMLLFMGNSSIFS